MTEVVGSELKLEAVGRAAERWDHHPGVVDEQVDLAVPVGGEPSDRREAREVQLTHIRLAGNRRRCGLAALEAAYGQGHLRAGGRQNVGCSPADAAVGTGDNHALARNIGNVCCRKARHGYILS